MGISQIDMLTGLNKEETAIQLMKAVQAYPLPFYGAFSGGKESVVIEHLSIQAQSEVEWHYCSSPIDPPEIRQFIRDYYPHVIWDYYARGWWKTVVIRQLPRRGGRWCCEIIKEAGGEGRTVIVGNRRSESRNRSKQKCFEPDTKKNSSKIFVRPIIDWDVGEVWEYIKKYNLPYCKLYRKEFGGAKRLGCVLCPLASKPNRLFELKQFPKIAKLWRLSCDKIVERRLSLGKDSFKTGQDLWDWWIG